jgi:hypothetical protein
LQGIEKIVTKGEKDFEFNFDYTSGSKSFPASSFNVPLFLLSSRSSSLAKAVILYC